MREELADAVAGARRPGPREQLASGWGYYLGDAAIAGVLCFGPPEGQKVTFVHPDDWLGPQRAWEPREALREVARRYADDVRPRHAPPVPRVVHLAQLQRRRRARGLRTSSTCASREPPSRTPGRSVRLLPEYDVYVMGFREREQLVPPAVREQVAAHGKGRYEGPAGVKFLLVDGVCAGIWSRKKGARRIELTRRARAEAYESGAGGRRGRGRAHRRLLRPRAEPDRQQSCLRRPVSTS